MSHRTGIIGAGIGGLVAALRLAHAGCAVDVFEAQSAPGGKMRRLPTSAGPVDAGPTVLTLARVFEELFADIGEDISQYLTLAPQDILARHFWSDGTQLDLFPNAEKNRASIAAVFGETSAREFQVFNTRTKKLFETFQAPIMDAAKPGFGTSALKVMRDPRIALAMAPHQTLAQSLKGAFSEPKLMQLFARYATYVGGSPTNSPALLSLIWQAEAANVWQIKGGMHGLAQCLMQRAVAYGATFHFNATVDSITVKNDRAQGLRLSDGTEHAFDTVLFNGDPAALRAGLMGAELNDCVPRSATEPRSLSAYVWSFAATPKGRDLALHNVFFAQEPNSEFGDIAKGEIPRDPTLYVYAQDRGSAEPPPSIERFEIIMNGAPTERKAPEPAELATCQNTTFQSLERLGLTFSPQPGTQHLTCPATFNALFPASNGSLYGRSPQGMMASFQRPTARCKIKGLYLAGGGVHPGAGVPMAALSGSHAAAAIMQDQTSTLRSRQTGTHGGMSTASQRMGSMQSRSSAS